MKNLPLLALFVLLCVVLAGCGGGYTPPPGGNAPKGGTGTTPDAPVNPKQSYSKEYTAATTKALASWTSYRRNKTSDNFALAGAHIYDALRFRAMHTRNGHSADKLPNYRELNEASKEWRSEVVRAPKGWEDHATYKESYAAYQAVQSE